MMCDCFLGFLCGEEVYLSNISEEVSLIVAHQIKFKEMGIMNGNPQSASQIVDGRKGYLSRFNFCPNCGNKNKWKSINLKIGKELMVAYIIA